MKGIRVLEKKDETVSKKFVAIRNKYFLTGRAYERVRDAVVVLEIPFPEVDPSFKVATRWGKPLFGEASLLTSSDGKFNLTAFCEKQIGNKRYLANTPPVPKSALEKFEKVKTLFDSGLVVWEERNWDFQIISPDPVLLGVKNGHYFLIDEWALTPEEEEFFK